MAVTGREVALAFAVVAGVVVIALLGRRLAELRVVAELERDESERREQRAEQLETEVRDARIAAAVSQQRAGFLSAISHNLRTPLTSIKAAASTLLSSWSRLDVEERRELVELIYDESDRLERLVRNTLQLSRIRAGGLERNPEPVDIADLVRHAVRRLAPISRKHLVRLSVDDALPDVVLDVAMMEQILLNLLENALRFAPPGSEILVSAAPDGADHWSLRIADHGPGVASDAREHVFEEFVSSDGRLGSTGTGLGLAIVRSLVVAQEGTVRYEETPGGGATFVCTFPLVSLPRSSEPA
jgi:two-component system sensor histidine kinase KdpD